MGIILDEQPPEDTDPKLKEWLSRLAIQINIDAKSQSFQGGNPSVDGLFMRWTGAYVLGKRYFPGEVVIEDGFTMICINTTEDNAAPQPDGPPSWSLPDIPLWSTESNAADSIRSGNAYTLNRIGWVEQLRIWPPTVSPTVDYWLRVTSTEGQITIPIPFAVVGEWNLIDFSRRIVRENTLFALILETVDSAGNTNYVEIVNNWPAGNPTWASTVEGRLAFIDTVQPGTGPNAYGADALFQPALLSPDWEIISLPEV